MSHQEMARIVKRLADSIAHDPQCLLVTGPRCSCGAWREQPAARLDALRLVRELRQ
jgi:hypothetical protein